MACYLLDKHQLFGVERVIIAEIISEKVIFGVRKGGENANINSFIIDNCVGWSGNGRNGNHHAG